jgi:two-component system sensor histidine kinase HydH
VLIWFAVTNYRSAVPLAEENLQGLSLSLSSAIESIIIDDPSLHSLALFRSRDLAFFAVIDRNGIYRFHSNPDLIGKALQVNLPTATLHNGLTQGSRVTLGTGEQVFEFNAPLYLAGEILALRLTLHTYRADTVIRHAQLNLLVMVCLLVAGWILSLLLHRVTLREESRKLAMAHRESLAQLGEMGAMLAHEIRNPLSGIKGYAQVIAKKPQDSRNGSFAELIVKETLRLETLVNDLLSYARNDREPETTVDLGEVIKSTVALIRHEAEPLRITIDYKPSDGLFVAGNRDRLEQVLLNLGMNALQAMPDGGTIVITASRVDSRALLRISDSGVGISQEDMVRIFEPFFTTKARGTGLGLALCRKIVEEHHGMIDVESVLGQGTAVTVTMPLHRAGRKALKDDRSRV